MFKKILVGIISTCGIAISTVSSSDVLCNQCEVRWIDTERDNGDIRFASTDGIGTGPCLGNYMTSKGTLNDRQKDQIMSVLLAALISGTKITAEGDNTSCGSLRSITIIKP